MCGPARQGQEDEESETLQRAYLKGDQGSSGRQAGEDQCSLVSPEKGLQGSWSRGTEPTVLSLHRTRKACRGDGGGHLSLWFSEHVEGELFSNWPVQKGTHFLFAYTHSVGWAEGHSKEPGLPEKEKSGVWPDRMSAFKIGGAGEYLKKEAGKEIKLGAQSWNRRQRANRRHMNGGKQKRDTWEKLYPLHLVTLAAPSLMSPCRAAAELLLPLLPLLDPSAPLCFNS